MSRGGFDDEGAEQQPIPFGSLDIDDWVSPKEWKALAHALQAGYGRESTSAELQEAAEWVKDQRVALHLVNFVLGGRTALRFRGGKPFFQWPGAAPRARGGLDGSAFWSASHRGTKTRVASASTQRQLLLDLLAAASGMGAMVWSSRVARCPVPPGRSPRELRLLFPVGEGPRLPAGANLAAPRVACRARRRVPALAQASGASRG